MNNPFKGIIVPSITPYLEDLSLDTRGVESVFAYFDDHPGLDGLFITGATGDYAVLTLEERKRILDIAVDMKLKKDWVPNTTTLERGSSVELTRYAVAKGIQTIGVILPQECKTFSDVCSFIRMILDLGVNVFIYQTGNTPYPLSVDEMGAVIALGSIVGIKDSCSPRDMYRHIRYITDYGSQITVIQGVEMLYLPSLSMGAHGVIGGGCNVYPQVLQKVRQAYEAGNVALAREMQIKVNSLFDQLSQEHTDNESMKYFLSLSGVRIMPFSRKSGPALSDRQKTVMQDMFSHLQSVEIVRHNQSDE